MAACKTKDENVQVMRGVLGSGPSDVELVRALHLAKNDVTLAFNILFDTLGYKGSEINVKRTTAGSGARVSTSAATQASSTNQVEGTALPLQGACPDHLYPFDASARWHLEAAEAIEHKEALPYSNQTGENHPNGLNASVGLGSRGEDRQGTCLHKFESLRTHLPDQGTLNELHHSDPGTLTELHPHSDSLRDVQYSSSNLRNLCDDDYSKSQLSKGDSVVLDRFLDDVNHRYCQYGSVGEPKQSNRMASCAVTNEYRSASQDDGHSEDVPGAVLVGEAEVLAYSTCKGSKLKAGDAVSFAFPKLPNASRGSSAPWARGRGAIAAQQIVRFYTKASGEIGRLPGEWARCLIPLVSGGNVYVKGSCRAAAEVLSTMDTVVLQVCLYASTSLFKISTGHPSLLPSSLTENTNHPLLALFRLLGKEPFRKAEFTPDDLYSRKRILDSKDDMLPAEKRRKLISNQYESAEQSDETLSDSDVNRLVGTTDSSDLQEMEPASTLQCDLRPYQKQALCWMSKLESGLSVEEASKTLHPCWDAYHLADKHASAVYLNVFSGEATMEFPSALKMARGGVLADAMGLGKTVMTIALLLTNPGKGSGNVVSEKVEGKSSNQKRAQNKSGQSCKKGGGTLIICPMTLLGQWKTEIETHSAPGALTVYAHYGSGRTRDVDVLLQHDVVLTTYGVLSAEYQSQGAGPLHSVHWYRVVLDEGHTIKASKSQTAQAVFAVAADMRWCLTGTPIQNKLEDAFSLLRFLRVEPWCNWGWWYKLIQKPFEEGDMRGLMLLKAILRPLMLRRTKDTTDKDGRPILVLPPSESKVVVCELSEAERDFYDALYKRSKVKFDQFVEQGKVLHNYASILELLLRMRQCCDHPFLVLSRGDTEEFTDLDKLARRFLQGVANSAENVKGSSVTKAYVQEVVDDLRKGNKAECPICLEAVEDGILTTCAHCMCRECLLASWNSGSGGLCPICRQYMTRQDIITAPSQSRFRVDVQKNWTESSKVSALLRELDVLRRMGSKSIVFSQWTAFLDLLQIPLDRQKHRYVRLDGTLNQQQREKVIKEFSTNPKILVMLISLKAGGVGINLTAASNAFLLDPWWNPAVEEQAINRIHRIGQTKRVCIKRFITKDTVEERMLQVQARKQRMIAGALTDQEIRSARIEELKMLFR